MTPPLWLHSTLYSYTEEVRCISLPGKHWLRNIEAQEHLRKEDARRAFGTSAMTVHSDVQPWQRVELTFKTDSLRTQNIMRYSILSYLIEQAKLSHGKMRKNVS